MSVRFNPFTGKFQWFGTTDHGSLAGLSDDDHVQYRILSPVTQARNVIQSSADVVGDTVKAKTGQTENLRENQLSDGTVKSFVSSEGDVAVKVDVKVIFDG